jgi:hypothetical protein
MARLFHSLVVCGAGLTLLNCGGRSAGQQGDGGADETSGSGGSSTAGKAGDGGRGGSGPVQGGASSGGLSLGGTQNAPMGGGAPSEPRRPEGPTEQWGCDASGVFCRGGRFDLDYADCVRDVTRPTSQAECGDGQVFTCLQGYLGQETVLFNCACSPTPSAGCACPEVLDNCGARLESPTSCGATSVCGCAITCILK